MAVLYVNSRLEAYVRPLQAYGLTQARFEDQDRHVLEQLRRGFRVLRFKPVAYNLSLKRKLLTAAWWTVPSLVCMILYWPGVLAWFQQDDFVWLNLPNQTHGWHGLLRTLFQPTVHGTWRPLSERVFS